MHIRLPSRRIVDAKLSVLPTLSFGIVLMDEESDSILMVKKRRTNEYCDLVRGAYNVSNLRSTIANIPEDERNLILSKEYDWLYSDCYGPEFLKELSLTRFNDIKEHLPKLFDKIPSTGSEAWSIPKGRRTSDESYLEAAIREFTEETGFTLERCVRSKMESTVVEHFGSNGNLYRTTYWFYKVKNQSLLNRANEIDRHEISQCRWFHRHIVAQMIPALETELRTPRDIS